MQDSRQKLLAARVGKVTAILSSSTLSLLLVGAGCAPAPAANVSVDAPVEVPGRVPSEEPVEPTPAPTDEAAPVSRKYKDGTYSNEGYYRSPAGSEKVGVTLVIKDDVVVDVTVTEQATNPKSIAMQKAFIGGIKAVVIGKKLDSIKVDKISGSSLTGAGFNEAVTKIKLDAKA